MHQFTSTPKQVQRQPLVRLRMCRPTRSISPARNALPGRKRSTFGMESRRPWTCQRPLRRLRSREVSRHVWRSGIGPERSSTARSSRSRCDFMDDTARRARAHTQRVPVSTVLDGGRACLLTSLARDSFCVCWLSSSLTPQTCATPASTTAMGRYCRHMMLYLILNDL